MWKLRTIRIVKAHCLSCLVGIWLTKWAHSSSLLDYFRYTSSCMKNFKSNKQINAFFSFVNQAINGESELQSSSSSLVSNLLFFLKKLCTTYQFTNVFIVMKARSIFINIFELIKVLNRQKLFIQVNSGCGPTKSENPQ